MAERRCQICGREFAPLCRSTRRWCALCSSRVPAEPELAPTLRDLDAGAGWGSTDDLVDALETLLRYDPETFDDPTPVPRYYSAPGLAAWIRRRFAPERLCRLNGFAGYIVRWEGGEVERVFYSTADAVLTACGGNIEEVPREIWA